VFTSLPESRPLRTRRATGTAMSFAVHSGIVFALHYVAAEAAPSREPSRLERVIFQERESEPPVEPLAPAVPLPPPLVPRVLTAPLLIPDVLPPIDLRQAITRVSDFAPVRQPPGTAAVPAAPQAGRPAADAVHTVLEVEFAAEPEPGAAPPAYPDAMRRAGVEGMVLVSYVVDTLGRADMSTFAVVRSSHDLFAQAVRRAVARMTFRPATVAGRAVRQLVQQPFSFAIVP
jgi:protein TonB